jgi:hypothetical protein
VQVIDPPHRRQVSDFAEIWPGGCQIGMSSVKITSFFCKTLLELIKIAKIFGSSPN